MKNVYSVWVGGSEINDYYINIKEARRLKEVYLDNGYKNVIIRKELKGGKENGRNTFNTKRD